MAVATGQVYSEDYRGRRYFYGCKRPVGVGHYPTDNLIMQRPPEWQLLGPHGILVSYTAPLTKEEIAAYELVPTNADGDPIIEVEMSQSNLSLLIKLLKDVEDSIGLPEWRQEEAMKLRLAVTFAFNAALRGRERY